MKLEEILSQETIGDSIDLLKEKNIVIPQWEELEKEYDATKHRIKKDQVERKDKGDYKAARITRGIQKLATRRMTQMTFTVPVKRTFLHGNEPLKMEQAKVLAEIYKKARIDSLNKKRFKAYFAACEMATIWYVVEKDNNDYGFESKHKLRSVSYSPMSEKFSNIEQANIYPLFDEFGDMIALSFEFVHRENDEDINYFETYTANRKYSWVKAKDDWQVNSVTEVPIGKIQGIYISRPEPIWEDQTNNVEQIEFTLSRHSDILRRNSAPVMKVKGQLVDNTEKPNGDVSREVYQFTDPSGDVDYVKPPVDTDAVLEFAKTMKENIFEELQIPMLSLNDITGVGLTEESRKQILVDAHLKVGEEDGNIIEFLSRECNVLKAFLGQIKKEWVNTIGDLEVEHEVIPFVMNNEMIEVETLSKATGGKPIMSQKTAIQRAGYVDESDIEKEIKQIQDEKQLNASNDLFNPSF